MEVKARHGKARQLGAQGWNFSLERNSSRKTCRVGVTVTKVAQMRQDGV